MRIFLDTEFIEDGRTIELLSLAAVNEQGRWFYRETEVSRAIKDGFVSAPEWIMDNVIPHLSKDPTWVATTGAIADGLVEFAGEAPEFWAYFADYDWVAVCQLYGRMIDLPPGWPMYCRDLRQALDERGFANVKSEPEPEDGPAHNALADARANLRTWRNYVDAFQITPREGGLMREPTFGGSWT